MTTYSKTAKELERHLKGVANHRRIEILILVSRHVGITLEELSNRLACNNKTLSEHTRRLVHAGLIHKEHQGRIVMHLLTPYGEKFLQFFQTL